MVFSSAFREFILRTPPFTAVSEFRDPLSESFRTFLYLSGDATKPQPVYPDEDADEYLEKVCK